jgi:cysteine-rich repeat protein
MQTGTCVPDNANGTICGGDGECTNGHCVDNVCCDALCNGLCQACTAAKKGSGADGTCAAIGAGTDPDNECSGTYSCAGASSCQSCSDIAKDGAETDVDCGGPTCNKCGNGQSCLVAADCMSGSCPAGTCVSTCGNGVISGSEQCDDNNLTSGDGCSGSCMCEATRTKQLGPGLNTSIPDDLYNGTLASMACVSVAMPQVNGCASTVTSVRVELGMTHTWVGDLVIKLVAPDGTIVTLMSRPGFFEAADDGTSGPGNNADLVNAAPVMFFQGAGTVAESMGGGGSSVVCQGDGICNYIPSKGAASGGDLNAFNGKTIAGTWRLCVGDSEVGDVGTIDQVKLTIGN